jgi:hypothetical protein
VARTQADKDPLQLQMLTMAESWPQPGKSGAWAHLLPLEQEAQVLKVKCPQAAVCLVWRGERQSATPHSAAFKAL